MGQEPCVSLATEAQTWLDKVATLEDVTKTVVPVSPRAIEDASLRLAMTYHASVPQKTDMPTMSHAVCQTACQAASHAACHVAALHFVFVIAFGTFELKCLH